MSNTEQMVSVPFQREDRYIVIRVSDLAIVPPAVGKPFAEQLVAIQRRLPKRECLVIESDWPEYEPTWAAIEARVAGKPAQHQGDPDRALKDALFACLAAGGDDREYGGVATAGGRQGWVRFTTVAAGATAQGRAGAVALPARDESLGTAERDEYANGYRHGWNAYNDEMAKLGPLYTHADAGEVERLRDQLLELAKTIHKRHYAKSAPDFEPFDFSSGLIGQIDNMVAGMLQDLSTLRAQLAERDALLRRCLLAVREQHCDEGEADFDLPAPLLSDIDAALSAQVRPAEAGELERLRAALKFYADREHYHFESGNWDTVSGEPLNILWCGDDPDFIEDGSVARAALSTIAEPTPFPGYPPVPEDRKLPAEPSAPKCGYCGDTGKIMVGRSGLESDGNAPIMEPCEDCDGNGHAHSNGMPIPGACPTCNGLGTVPDGAITGVGGVVFENGPVECIKECPDCKPGAQAEVLAQADGVLTFMRSDRDGPHKCSCCDGAHVFCRHFQGMPDFNDLTLEARLRTDLEGRVFRVVLQLLPVGTALDRR